MFQSLNKDCHPVRHFIPLLRSVTHYQPAPLFTTEHPDDNLQPGKLPRRQSTKRLRDVSTERMLLKRKEKKKRAAGTRFTINLRSSCGGTKTCRLKPGHGKYRNARFHGVEIILFPPPLLWKTAGRHGHISAERLKLKIQHIIIWSAVKAAERKLFPEVKVPPNGVCIFNVTTEEKPWNCAGWCCSHWEILQPASWKQGRFCFPYILPHLCCQGSGC